MQIRERSEHDPPSTHTRKYPDRLCRPVDLRRGALASAQAREEGAIMARTTFYQARYQCWPPVHNRDMVNPNSSHWQTQGQLTQRRLNELLGDDDYELWAEITWPGDSVGYQSWKQIFDTCQWALDHQDATNQTLECTCNPTGGDACLVCKANARIREQEEYSR